jgi:hypothetical protein
MTKLSTREQQLAKPIIPFTPTVDERGQPTICHCCGRRAIGIGITPKGDPGYLCGECILLVEELRKVRRMDLYELAALDGAVDAMGDYIESKGNLTDLAHYDELDQRLLAKAAVMGFADRLRKLLREGAAPF